MSEDRTQAPSQRRRHEAREQGVVARSPELTAAVGLLAAVVMLGVWGPSLVSALVDIVRAPFLAANAASADSAPDLISGTILHVFTPVAGILLGVIVAMVVAHQAQVGGLWVPNLIAPDLSRIGPRGGLDWSVNASRGLWSLAKAAVVVAVVTWAVMADFEPMLALSSWTAASLATASGAILKGVVFKLGLATLLLGVMDYLLVRSRIEAMLRVTPEQQKEDQKAVDGDPAVRSRRQHAARSLRSDPGDVLTGAVLVVAGPGGLAVVLGGEGPPSKITVRAIARGSAGAILRRSAEKHGLPVKPAPAIAAHFAGGSARSKPLPDSLSQELAALWPAATGLSPLPLPAHSPK